MKMTNWADLSKEEKDKGRLDVSLIYLFVIAAAVFIASAFPLPPIPAHIAKCIITVYILLSFIRGIMRISRKVAEAHNESIEACKHKIDKELIERDKDKAIEELTKQWLYTAAIIVTPVVAIVDVFVAVALFKLWE